MLVVNGHQFIMSLRDVHVAWEHAGFNCDIHVHYCIVNVHAHAHVHVHVQRHVVFDESHPLHYMIVGHRHEVGPGSFGCC